MCKVKATFLYIRIGNGGPDEGRELIALSKVKEVSGKKTICPKCSGKGITVNPNIDGLTGSDLNNLGHSFSENYKNGHYDIACSSCEGSGITIIVDEDALSPKDKKAYKAYLLEKDAEDLEAYYERLWQA